jgi:2-dehydro-3-deoxyphosphogluconate aldolase/(4S)-4-hydroxy-2-oxoglutarate aldolase
MMKKYEVLKKMLDNKLVAVIRTDSPNVKEIVEHIIKGGVSAIEITLTMKNSLELISILREEYQNTDVLIGAGTVLDQTSARLAINHGAQFIVAPVLDTGVAEICNLYSTLYIPGVSNPTNIYQALKLGLDFLKLFPASVFSPSIIKDMQGPFPQVNFMISGKVNEKTINDWLSSGASVVCVGSAFTNAEKDGYDSVTKAAKKFVELIH